MVDIESTPCHKNLEVECGLRDYMLFSDDLTKGTCIGQLTCESYQLLEHVCGVLSEAQVSGDADIVDHMNRNDSLIISCDDDCIIIFSYRYHINKKCNG